MTEESIISVPLTEIDLSIIYSAILYYSFKSRTSESFTSVEPDKIERVKNMISIYHQRAIKQNSELNEMPF